MDLRVAAYAVIERRGKILLTHWRRGHLHGWTLPGGGLEAGEDPRDAVVREILEETGLTGKVGKLLGVDSRVMVREEVADGVDPALHTIRIVYRATVLDGELQNEVNGSSDEARWVALRDVNSLKTLSLVQTGLRMAGITTRGNSNAGRGGAKATSAKGAAGNAGARGGSGRSGAQAGERSGESGSVGERSGAGDGRADTSEAGKSGGTRSGRSRSRSRSRSRARKRSGS